MKKHEPTNAEKLKLIESLSKPIMALLALSAIENDAKLSELAVEILKRLDTHRDKYNSNLADIEREQFKANNTEVN